MNVLLVETIKTVVIPVLTAVATVYFSNKITSQRDRKIRNEDREKQAQNVFLRIESLIKSIESHNKLVKDINEFKEEIRALENGEKVYVQEDEMNEDLYIAMLDSTYKDWVAFSLPERREEVIKDFYKLKECNFNLMKADINFNILKLIEKDDVTIITKKYDLLLETKNKLSQIIK